MRTHGISAGADDMEKHLADLALQGSLYSNYRLGQGQKQNLKAAFAWKFQAKAQQSQGHVHFDKEQCP